MKANNKKNRRRARVLERAEQDLKIEEIRVQRNFWDTPTRREKMVRLRRTIEVLKERVIR